MQMLHRAADTAGKAARIESERLIGIIRRTHERRRGVDRLHDENCSHGDCEKGDEQRDEQEIVRPEFEPEFCDVEETALRLVRIVVQDI